MTKLSLSSTTEHVTKEYIGLIKWRLILDSFSSAHSYRQPQSGFTFWFYEMIIFYGIRVT